MVQFKDIFSPIQIAVNVNVASKKRALEVLAKVIVAHQNELDEQQVFDKFIERERLGSTGFGDGVAIPHCRMTHCKEPTIALLKLATGIDFSAVDEQPVDILMALVVPIEATEDHLQLLKQIAQLLSNAKICLAIRQSVSSEQIYQIIIDEIGSNT